MSSPKKEFSPWDALSRIGLSARYNYVFVPRHLQEVFSSQLLKNGFFAHSPLNLNSGRNTKKILGWCKKRAFCLSLTEFITLTTEYRVQREKSCFDPICGICMLDFTSPIDADYEYRLLLENHFLREGTPILALSSTGAFETRATAAEFFAALAAQDECEGGEVESFLRNVCLSQLDSNQSQTLRTA